MLRPDTRYFRYRERGAKTSGSSQKKKRQRIKVEVTSFRNATEIDNDPPLRREETREQVMVHFEQEREDDGTSRGGTCYKRAL